ncbi:hypothetical protein BC833DRAFT_619653 [Globomyces pollinis-pini]|nr:hypothetical protein BC833DRAFT_619653 [Globomyces pollinis-pini]
MALTASNFVLPLCIAAMFAFGAWAIGSYIYAKKQGVYDESAEFFLTAKNSQPWYRVAWGFYACSVGAGVLFSVPGYVAMNPGGGGWLGLINYSVFAGLPFVLMAYIGIYIKKRFPAVLSIGSFAKWRFGPFFSTWVTLNVIFNLGIALTAEYTAIGGVFKSFLGTERWVPIVLVGLITMSYTAIGGLYVSLVTDQVQSIFIFLILAIVGTFVAVNFRVDILPSPLPDHLALNDAGKGSFLTLGVALVSSTMFSDAIWQRVWSAKDDKALIRGSWIGAIMVIVIVFLFGLGGFISSWAGLVTDDPNNAFLELLKIGGEIPIGMLLCICLIATTMNEAAVDSYQIALSDTVGALFEGFGVELNVWLIRGILICLNVPIAIVGCFGFSIINLYLITNLLTTCLLIPFCCGLIPSLDFIVTGGAALFSSLSGVFGIIIYAVIDQLNKGATFSGQTIIDGIVFTFYSNFDYPGFAVALVSSLAGLLIYVGAGYVYYSVTGKERPTPAHLIVQKDN